MSGIDLTGMGVAIVTPFKEDKTIEDEYEITITLSEETGTYRIYTYNPDGTVKERSDKKTYTGGVINEKIKVNKDFKDRLQFAKKQWLNMCNAGKFSSDRTIKEYAKQIWKIK